MDATLDDGASFVSGIIVPREANGTDAQGGGFGILRGGGDCKIFDVGQGDVARGIDGEDGESGGFAATEGNVAGGCGDAHKMDGVEVIVGEVGE